MIAIVEMVNAALDKRYAVVNWQSAANVMARNTWSDTGLTVLAVAAITAGALLLVLGLRRGQPEWLALQPVSTDTHGFVSRSALRHALGDAAAEVDGVSWAKVRLQRRTATVVVELLPGSGADTSAQVLERVRGHRAFRGLLAVPKVKVLAKASQHPVRDRDVVPEPVALIPPAPAVPPPAASDVTSGTPTTAVPPAAVPPAAASPTAESSTAPGAPTPASSAPVAAANFGTPTRRVPSPGGLDLPQPDPTSGQPDPAGGREEER
ncbi:DUF6286 domain-containing protein [Protofrankia symbiont of Coriaria myrtifolia]|uniref:DUF6286 domain-containing protein n=1 Tax=Protofrankia symbiont of Coriaria myrtifolia TaxID=1306540 RepID=UPI001041028F|nr:DUF6286 domain-containing protein [Protofrankia symbiont of Coriaria myrtifolia]